MYRPPNVKNPHIRELPDGNLRYGGQRYFDWEAGADAMLEGLRKGGYILGESLVNTKSVGWQNINPKSKWYFIPDEES